MSSHKISVILLLGLLSACGSDSSTPQPQPEASYQIIQDESSGNVKRSVKVMLPEKIGEAELREIALYIKSSKSASYQRTFIGYFLSEDGQNHGYWATTHFNPELKVNVLGLTSQQAASLAKNNRSQPEENVIGAWLDARPGIGAKMTLYRSNEKLMLRSVYSDGSSGEKVMVSQEQGKSLRLEEKPENDFGEYVVVK